jgi:NADPH-dependent 2,4-dienoyl-CoA reductase/sulfur reductase-like enzyme
MHPDARTRGAIPAQGVGGHPRRITVIGTGYVGLMTGATLAQLGHTAQLFHLTITRA